MCVNIYKYIYTHIHIYDLKKKLNHSNYNNVRHQKKIIGQSDNKNILTKFNT